MRESQSICADIDLLCQGAPRRSSIIERVFSVPERRLGFAKLRPLVVQLALQR